MMKNPSHPGSLIKSDLDGLGLSVVEAAKAPGISRQQLHSVIGGRAGVTPEMAVRLEKALGSMADAWLRMQMNYDLAQIRAKASSLKVKRLASVGACLGRRNGQVVGGDHGSLARVHRCRRGVGDGDRSARNSRGVREEIEPDFTRARHEPTIGAIKMLPAPSNCTILPGNNRPCHAIRTHCRSEAEPR